MYINKMACYVVTFEVNNVLKRNALKEGLKSYGSYCPIHDNAWAIITPNTAAQIRDHLTPFIDPTDRLFVVRSGSEAAWSNAYGEQHSDWLKKNL